MRPEIERAVALLQSGDDKATEQALALLQNTVFSFSMKVCGQREDAEDTMQEVLVKAVPYLTKFDSPKALLVWIYKVAKNRCLMSRRRSKFAPTRDLSLEGLMPDRKELETLVAGGVNPEMFAIRNEQAVHLRQAIQKLPPRYRIVLVLRDMEELTDDEVAEITGLRPGTVRVRLHRARLFMRKELMKKQGKPASGKASEPLSSRSVSASEPKLARCNAMFAELSNYLDEKLGESLCEELDKHLEGCDPCQVFLAGLEATIRECRRIPGQVPDRAKTIKLRKEVMARYEKALTTGAN